MEAYSDWQKKSDQDKEKCHTLFDEVMIKLFLNLLRLYKDRKKIGFCPLCFEMKTKEEIREIHIIPKCMLERFRLIHVPVQKLNVQKIFEYILIFRSVADFLHVEQL